MYARNYGQDPLWLPGLVVGLEGSDSAVYGVRLNDSRVVHRHGDQLRFRAGGCETDSPATSGLLEDIPNPCTGVEASTAEPETVVTEQNGSQAAPRTVTTDSANPPTPVSDVDPSATETLSE